MRASTAARLLIGVVAFVGVAAVLALVQGDPEARELVGGFSLVAAPISRTLTAFRSVKKYCGGIELMATPSLMSLLASPASRAICCTSLVEYSNDRDSS